MFCTYVMRVLVSQTLLNSYEYEQTSRCTRELLRFMATCISLSVCHLTFLCNSEQFSAQMIDKRGNFFNRLRILVY